MRVSIYFENQIIYAESRGVTPMDGERARVIHNGSRQSKIKGGFLL